jgi:hypothetical protein
MESHEARGLHFGGGVGDPILNGLMLADYVAV